MGKFEIILNQSMRCMKVWTVSMHTRMLAHTHARTHGQTHVHVYTLNYTRMHVHTRAHATKMGTKIITSTAFNSARRLSEFGLN